MNLVSRAGERLVFELSQREKVLLAELLRRFPLVPVSHHRLSRGATNREHTANQRLLEEAMAARNQDLQGRVRKFLEDKGRFVQRGSRCHLTLTREEVEWLLQVLNDVRVGSWLQVGCPDPDEGREPQVNESNATALLLMELSGHFEYELVEALDDLEERDR